jgi:hypothetical protein
MDKIEVKPNLEGGKITYAEGKLADPVAVFNPLPFKIKGFISEPFKYWKNKEDCRIAPIAGILLDVVLITRPLVLVDIEEGKVLLDLYHGINLSCTVEGFLTVEPELQALGINSNKIWNVKELAKFIKLNRFVFKDRDAAADLLENLQQFTAEVNMLMQDKNDGRGNTNQQLQSKLTTDLALDFVVSLPLYQGFKPVAFKVEIGIDLRDGGIDLWLESAELKELLRDERRRVIMEQVEAFEKAGVPVVMVAQ